MKDRLRVAGVGAGYFSTFHYDAWSRLDEVTLEAVCDADRARAEDMAKRFSAARTFEDAGEMLDAVKPGLFDIAVPPAAHAGMIRLGAERGIPMICQKPFCGSVAEAEDAVRLCEEAGVSLVVHENFRFQPWYRKIRTMLEEDLLGPVYQVTFRLRPGDGQGAQAYLDRQPYFQTMERFLVHETAIHLIDVFRYLFGEVTDLYADLARLNPAIAGEDAGLILFNFDSGVRGLFDGNRLADHRAENRRLTMGELLIEGEKATLALNGDGGLSIRSFGSNDWAPVDYDWQNTGFGGDCVYAFQQHVVAHLNAEGQAENTGRAYLTNLRIEEAVYRSSSNHTRITL